jgi:3-hydroxy-9,10-secoandrosta-1,3,5(10)-triene-9,17-dione monooxygenase reductase component
VDTRPAFDARAFRRTVGHFATGVTVIAIEAEGAIKAMTANSFTSLSLDPPLVLFCVGQATNMGRLIGGARGFSVNILCEDQEDLSAYFAGVWKDPSPPPFSFVPWEGGPRLERCRAALGCTVEAVHEGGDHWIVVGRVLALHEAEPPSRPLLFHEGRYSRLVD